MKQLDFMITDNAALTQYMSLDGELVRAFVEEYLQQSRYPYEWICEKTNEQLKAAKTYAGLRAEDANKRQALKM